jgi:hypothetical protein
MYSFQRGYPCGLWQLLHALVARASSDTGARDSLMRVRTLVGSYFQCKVSEPYSRIIWRDV